VLLLHGFLGAGRNLAGLARRWSEADPTLSLFTVDLTGHGASPALPPAADLSTLAADVLDTAHALASGAVDLVGHSLGGRVALAASTRDPEAVRSTILLDIAPGPIPPLDTPLLARLLAQAPERVSQREEMREWFAQQGLASDLTEWLLTNLVPVPGGLGWRVDRSALLRLGAAVATPDLWSAVERPGAHVACIHGGMSPYVTDADVQRFRSAGAPVIAVEEAGHFLHVERPAQLVFALQQALSDLHAR